MKLEYVTDTFGGNWFGISNGAGKLDYPAILGVS